MTEIPVASGYLEYPIQVDNQEPRKQASLMYESYVIHYAWLFYYILL